MREITIINHDLTYITIITDGLQPGQYVWSFTRLCIVGGISCRLVLCTAYRGIWTAAVKGRDDFDVFFSVGTVQGDH